MKYLLYADAVLLATGAAMTVSLAVVCLLFGVYHGASPEVTRGLPTLMVLTGGFFGWTVFAGAAWHGLRRSRPWRWPAQAALAVALPLIFMTIFAALRGP